MVVRGCPRGTVQDCCEWHACGTAVDDDAVYPVAPLAPPRDTGHWSWDRWLARAAAVGEDDRAGDDAFGRRPRARW
jgi:hypothetical protein